MKFLQLLIAVFFMGTGVLLAQQETGSTQTKAIDVTNMDQTVSPNVDFYQLCKRRMDG